MNWEQLLPYAKTEVQTQTLKDLIKYKSIRNTAKELGKARSSIQNIINTIKKHAAKKGFAPDNDFVHPTAPGFAVKRVSTNYNAEGGINQQWVIQTPDKEQLEILQDTLKEAFETYKNKSYIITPPKVSTKQQLTLYPIGDAHYGMYSYHEETGDNFNTEIASKELKEAVNYLVDRAPATDTAIILNLGDWYHGDNLDNKTSRSGHTLDVDTRWSRVIKLGVLLMIDLINKALSKHKKVIVKNIQGNHDDHSSIMLAIALSMYFKNNKRVEIDESPRLFWYYEFGKVLLGSTHGHMAKFPDLQGIMMADRPQEVGRTEFRYWHTGHVHHDAIKEYPGCRCESHRTLAAPDAYSASKFRSGRDMKAIVYDKDYGEDTRIIYSIKRRK